MQNWEKELYDQQKNQQDALNKAWERGDFETDPMDIVKGGEGSRGGKVIGHTKSGNPIYSLGHKVKYFHSGLNKNLTGKIVDYKHSEEGNHTYTIKREGTTDHHEGIKHTDISLMKSDPNNLQKGKAANSGEIRIWGGQKMQKQADGIWKPVKEVGAGKPGEEKIEVGQKYHSPAPDGGEAIDFTITEIKNNLYTIETSNEEGRRGYHTFDEKTIKELIAESKLDDEVGKTGKGGESNLQQIINRLSGINYIDSRWGVSRFGQKVLKIQSKTDPSRHLTISPEYDRGKYLGNAVWEKQDLVPGKYNISITSGSIDNPSKTQNSTWSNYGNKSHGIDDVIKVIKSYFPR